MSAVVTDHEHDHDHHDHKPSGIKRWLYTTNHKDIGTMYLVFALIMFFIGGAMAMVIRAELFQPGMQFVEPNFFNQMTTVHGLIMVFGAVMPAFTGLANWMIPMMIGAPDMALPRMNNWSFWILPFAFLILLISLFLPGGGPNFGWTFYAPLSTTYSGDSTALFVFSVCFATLPVTSLHSINLSYQPRPTATDPNPAPVTRDSGTGSTFDTAMVDAIDGSMSGAGGSLSNVPAWWFTVMSISAGANTALRAGINYADNPVPDDTLNPLFPATITTHYTLGLGWNMGGGHALAGSIAIAPKVTRTNPNMFGPGMAGTVSHRQNTLRISYNYSF